MCTKTKTSYGCGHSYKNLDACGDDCLKPERYYFVKDGDCPGCRKGGSEVTRGREGKGRYGRKMKTPRERGASASPEHSELTVRDDSADVSPWAPKNRQEKSWDSPTRRMADDAWLMEHGERMSVSEAADSLARVSLSGRRSEKYGSPHGSREYVVEPSYEHDDEYEPTSSRPNTQQGYYSTGHAMPPYVYDEERGDSSPRSEQPYRSRRRRHRQHSHDSEGSMPVYLESPMRQHKHKLVVAPIAAPMVDFEARDKRGHRTARGAKTEPYIYASPVQWGTPVSGSPYSTGTWPDHSNNVVYPMPYEIVQQPRRHYRGH